MRARFNILAPPLRPSFRTEPEELPLSGQHSVTSFREENVDGWVLSCVDTQRVRGRRRLDGAAAVRALSIFRLRPSFWKHPLRTRPDSDIDPCLPVTPTEPIDCYAIRHILFSRRHSRQHLECKARTVSASERPGASLPPSPSLPQCSARVQSYGSKARRNSAAARSCAACEE